MKVYCGLFHEGNIIKLAFLRKSRDKFILLKLLTLPSSRMQTEKIASAKAEMIGTDFGDVIIDYELENENLPYTNLHEIFEFFEAENTIFIPTITQPNVSFYVYNNLKEDSKNKSKIEQIKDWIALLNPNIEKDEIDFVEYKNNNIIAIYSYEEPQILTELNILSKNTKLKSLDIPSIRFADVSLINFFFNNYNINNLSSYLLLYKGVESIRMIFIKEGKVVHINDYLSYESEKYNLINYLVSKIYYELEYTDIKTLNEIIIAGEINSDFILSLKQNFPFTSISSLDLKLIEYSNTDYNEWDIQSYSLPIISVIDYILPYKGIRKNLKSHSKSISKISILKKIDFISIVLFLILSYLSFYSINEYIKKVEIIKSIKDQIERNKIVTISHPYSAEINRLETQLKTINKYLEITSELKLEISALNKIFTSIDQFSPIKKGIWLTNIEQKESDNLISIKGLAIDRNQIPKFAQIFEMSEIKSINIYEIRGKKIFQFEIEFSLKG